jgi:N-acetylmuramoyl-L-alanine amidase
VTLTRTANDTQGPCTAVRAAIGNRADVALSIHADGGPPGGRGFHVIEPGLLPGYTDDIRAASSRLGTALRDAMRGTGMPDSTYIGSAGLDVRTDLVGLVLSDTPKVFLETGNMRNAADARLLGSASFRDAVATAIADAVVAWRRSR